jgi:hypothetical protein
MSTKLRGWVIPADGIGSVADHTYVTSSDGKAWGCWGRSSGGKKICSGKGSSQKASCISGPLGYAGIVYAATGVCHQTANRILRPSKKTVSKARGYNASWLLYGAYGINVAHPLEWRSRKIACNVKSPFLKPDPLYSPQAELQQTENETYFDIINTAYSKFDFEIQNSNTIYYEIEKELATIEINAYLTQENITVDQNKILSLINSRTDMLKELENEKKSIIESESNAGYGKRANLLLNDLLKTAATLFDAHEYEAIFDFKPGAEVTVVRQLDTTSM